jgi:hypothetical protein
VENLNVLRNSVISNLLNESTIIKETVSASIDGDNGFYTEIIPINDIMGAGQNILEFIDNYIDDEIDVILESHGYGVDYNRLDKNTSDLYDGYRFNIPINRVHKDPVEEFFVEIDEELNNQQPQQTPQQTPQQINPNVVNRASNVPLTQEPNKQQIQNLPVAMKKQKTQNPKKVDLILKNVFQSKFTKYRLSTDAGKWSPTIKPEPNGKLSIRWENKEAQNIKIDCLLFPNDTNKIEIWVKNSQGQVLMDTFFEIYRIPTNEFIGEKFFRKTFFNLLKKYIDMKVILLDPFVTRFVFWKSDNPTYSYSFSSPKKNKIILDLIQFINTAQKPILDDFFEQNNLKHKQGYLQTLLDSSESAGIFRFKREGNEIIILRGPNYKAFLEGKVRRVM